MPLWIEGQKLTRVPTSTPVFVKAHPHFQNSASELCKSDVERVVSPGLLYVMQREYAVVSPRDQHISVLGSEDATTCHFVVIRHSGSGVTSLGHFDGCQTRRAIKDMISEIKQASVGGPEGKMEVHLVGGFSDSRTLSWQLSKEVLQSLISQSEHLHLQTACITDQNNTIKDGINFPVIYGLAVDVKSGRIYPASFPDQGPDTSLRAAAVFTGVDTMQCIYTPKEELLEIGPFNWHPSRCPIFVLDYQDDYIRKNLSTSPEQEPEHFVQHVRDALTFVRDNPNPEMLFPSGLPRKYRKNADGTWTLIK